MKKLFIVLFVFTCIAKYEAPFGGFVCEHNEMFEPYEEAKND